MTTLDSDFAFGKMFRKATAADFGLRQEHDAFADADCRRLESAGRHGGAVDFRRSWHHVGGDIHDRLSGAAIRYACDMDSPAYGADGGAEHSYFRRRDEASAAHRTSPSFGTHHHRRPRRQSAAAARPIVRAPMRLQRSPPPLDPEAGCRRQIGRARISGTRRRVDRDRYARRAAAFRVARSRERIRRRLTATQPVMANSSKSPAPLCCASDVSLLMPLSRSLTSASLTDLRGLRDVDLPFRLSELRDTDEVICETASRLLGKPIKALQFIERLRAAKGSGDDEIADQVLKID